MRYTPFTRMIPPYLVELLQYLLETHFIENLYDKKELFMIVWLKELYLPCMSAVVRDFYRIQE